MRGAFEYPSRRRRRLGKSISTEIGSSPDDSWAILRVRQKLSFVRGEALSPLLFFAAVAAAA